MKLKKKFLTSAFLALGLLTLGVAGFRTETKSASALTTTTYKYLTNGSTNNGSSISSGCPSNFKIYMYGSSSTNGTGTLNQDAVTDWSYYYIYVDAIKVSDHRSFRLTKEGKTIQSASLSGSSDKTLYQGSLADGEYELEYTCRYAKNNFVVYAYYTYTYRFEVDKTAPVGSLTAGGYSISSGSYTNKQIVYSVTDAHFSHLRYKRPNSSSYSSSYSMTYTVPTTETNGWWYFYAVDMMVQSSATMSVYLDTVVPVGNVTNASGGTVANGGYANSAIKYTATDSGSGVSYCQYKKPGATSWTTYTAGTAVTGKGWHTWRSVDRAGNYSAEYKIFYDATAAKGTLYAGTSMIVSGSHTNANYIKYEVIDSDSGLEACYVRMPGNYYYTTYTSGTQLTMEGTYYFYSLDKSNNMSSIVNITLDKTKPTGTIYAGNSVVISGTTTNADYVSFMPYDAIGVTATYVKAPGSSTYQVYSIGTQLTAEGTYSFYSRDKVNTSEVYTVTLDRQIPTAQLFVDEMPFNNNGYTNGAHIKFECEETCYVKLRGSDSFSLYVSGVEYYKPGKYVFYGESEAGNSTGYYTIIIDRTIKTVAIENVENGWTDGDVTISWVNGNAETFAPIKQVSVNGKPYVKGEPIYTIDTGVYHVVCEDAAGNIWETTFSSSKRNVYTQTFQKEYYEAHDSEGNYYTFSSYESAFAFAVARENSYVRTGEWHNVSWDTGIAMDTVDSVNAVNGTYYIYKKSDVSNEEVAYFTKARLDEVIAQYAKENIHHYYYWEKEYAPIADGENLFSYSDTKTVLADKILLCENIGLSVDGQEFIGTVYDGEGKHTLTVYDEWGNSCDYTVIVVRSAPDIHYVAGEGSSNLVVFDRTYRFKEAISVFITDDNDEFSMFAVYNGAGDLLGMYHLDDLAELTESGEYTVKAINHYGESKAFKLIISRFAPEVHFEENDAEKQLLLRLTPSIDGQSNIQTLEVFKSTNDGESWILLDKDDYGTLISLDTLTYHFRTSGLYKAVIMDEFRTGFEAIVGEVEYKQKIPNGVLTGVSNGGYTNGIVKFEWLDEAMVTLWKDDLILEYKSGMELMQDGNYLLVFENYDGFKETYEFVIDTQSPELMMEGVKMQGKTQTNVSVHYTETEFMAKLYKDGVEVGDYASGTEITETGLYVVKITDYANNTNEISFAIDKIVDYNVNVNDKGLANSVTITANEEVFIALLKDEVAMDYVLDTELNTPGQYSVTIMDLLGNTENFTFTIIEPKVKEFTHNFDNVPGFEMVVMNGTEKRLNYGTLELFDDGTHEVGVLVNGITYTFTVTVDATAPTLKLNGVENGGETKDTVTITDISEIENVKVELNG